MNIADAIARILTAIRGQFYHSLPARDYKRDEPALTRAILHWCKEYDERGWSLDEVEFSHHYLTFLATIDPPRTQHLPIYLKTCVERYIGQRAETLRAEQIKLRRIDIRVAESLKKISKPTQDTSAPIPTTMHIGAAMLAQIRAEASRKRKVHTASKAAHPSQPLLL